ncbi:hypothetical protein SORBI_3008G013600 [Sorghum bicolor]|uniref:Uncharacterized protein n=1 Tax=Sorghum bicolor TaxID=4558 RepID=A0A1B6PB78_SORBI|nr:hypothetical protein SORBI_3008G013600 [Sorghum bicolor]
MHRCRPCCACLCPPLSPLLRSLHPHLRLSPPASQFVCCPRLVRCCLRLRQFVWSPSPVALCPPHILIQACISPHCLLMDSSITTALTTMVLSCAK